MTDEDKTLEDKRRENVEAKFRDAKAALFALEEALGPPGSELRRRIYAVRCEVGYDHDAYRRRDDA